MKRGSSTITRLPRSTDHINLAIYLAIYLVVKWQIKGQTRPLRPALGNFRVESGASLPAQTTANQLTSTGT